ncbi:MAG: diacylglycerol kinase family protein [Bacteroidia bacterium]|nr:diacylglycerol kinase family protein [Bacteroidia bacterium]
MNSDKFSLKTRFGSFKFAFHGLWLLMQNEHNSRIHFLAAIIAIAMGIILKINPYEWSLLIIVIGIVFLTELLNSSLETLADFVNPEWNEKIRNVKDYAAAAVLISAIISVVVGAFIFIPKILDLI